MKRALLIAMLALACCHRSLTAAPIRRSRISWHRGAGDYRALRLARNAAGVSVFTSDEDFTLTEGIASPQPRFALPSVRVFEHDLDGVELQEVPAQFDPASDFQPRRNARGTVTWVAPPRDADTRLFAIYWTSQRRPTASTKWPRAIRYSVTDDPVWVETGPGGLRYEFSLGPRANAPRWIGLAFDSDADFAEEDDVLGQTGFAGGGAGLTAVQDGVAWYDFGAYQNWRAKVQVAHHGPASLTLRISGLGLYGGGDVVKRKGLKPAKLVGWADWTFRFYRHSDFVDQRVDFVILDTAPRWTRDLHVRYGLKRHEHAGTRREANGGPNFAWADDFALVALPSEGLPTPLVEFHPQARCLQVTFPGTRNPAFGPGSTGWWRLMRARRGQDAYARACVAPEMAKWGPAEVRRAFARLTSMR